MGWRVGWHVEWRVSRWWPEGVTNVQGRRRGGRRRRDLGGELGGESGGELGGELGGQRGSPTRATLNLAVRVYGASEQGGQKVRLAEGRADPIALRDPWIRTPRVSSLEDWTPVPSATETDTVAPSLAVM